MKAVHKTLEPDSYKPVAESVIWYPYEMKYLNQKFLLTTSCLIGHPFFHPFSSGWMKQNHYWKKLLWRKKKFLMLWLHYYYDYTSLIHLGIILLYTTHYYMKKKESFTGNCIWPLLEAMSQTYHIIIL